ITGIINNLNGCGSYHIDARVQGGKYRLGSAVVAHNPDTVFLESQHEVSVRRETKERRARVAYKCVVDGRNGLGLVWFAPAHRPGEIVVTRHLSSVRVRETHPGGGKVEHNIGVIKRADWECALDENLAEVRAAR